MAVINLQEEVYKRKALENKNNVTNVDSIENIVKKITQIITTEYGELVNEVSRGEKSNDVLKNVINKTIIRKGYSIENMCNLEQMVQKVLDCILGYEKLQQLIKDPDITDIFINGPQNVYKRLNKSDYYVPEMYWKDNNELLQYIRSILTKFGKNIHSAQPLVDARDIKNHIRINAGIPPVAKIPYMAIRKHTVYDFILDDFLANNTFTLEVLEFLKKAIQAKLNILIAGPTGSGKTTLLRFLAQEFIPENERIVVIEEEEELKIKHNNQVRLEAKKKAGEDDTNIDMDQLVKNSLRMAMRRIILGELRGAEAFSLLRAFGTGHDGGMTTVHANNTYNSIEQLAVMMLYANTPLEFEHLKKVISQSLDLVVYVENYKVIEVTFVDNYDENIKMVKLNQIFATDRNNKGELICEYKGVCKNLEHLFWKRGVKV